MDYEKHDGALLGGRQRFIRGFERTALEHLEVLAMLPIGHVRKEAGNFEFLQRDNVIDEIAAHFLAEERAGLERAHRVHQRPRQYRTIGVGVGIDGRRAGIERLLDTVQARDQVGRQVQVRIGGRLADAVFEVCAGVGSACRSRGSSHRDSPSPSWRDGARANWDGAACSH